MGLIMVNLNKEVKLEGIVVLMSKLNKEYYMEYNAESIVI